MPRHHYESTAQLNEHLQAFLLAYNHAKRLKRLHGLTPHEFVCAQRQRNPTIFTQDPTQLTLGLYSTQPIHTAQARCLEILAYVRATGSTKMLNDGSEDEVGWQALTPWVAEVFLPQLAAQGVVAVAWVSPHNLRALVCMNEVLAARTYLNVAVFVELEDAYAWLCKAARLPK